MNAEVSDRFRKALGLESGDFLDFGKSSIDNSSNFTHDLFS